MRIRTMAMALVALTTLSGCTFQGALDAMVEPDRQAELIRTAQTLCRTPQALQPQFAPDLWAQSQPMFAGLPGQCPTDANVIWQLTTYNFNTSANVGAPTDRREYALVVAGDADGPWSEIQLNFQQTGDGPQQIIGWNAARITTRPASLAFIDSYDQIRWWGLGGVALALAALVTALLWFRRRRKAQGKGWNDA
jgi:hypothetical protein